MKLTRRNFVGTLGASAAASLLASTTLVNRGASAQTRVESASKIYDGGIIQLNQNESARGPGPKTLEALHAHVNKRLGRGYSPDHVVELEEVLAAYYGVTRDNVLLATGSTPLLQGSVRAFCSANRGLVTAAPTYATSEGTARTIGAPVRQVIVTADGEINLAGMAEAASGAGLVYFCNPNNPTGTVHGPEAVEQFVRRVMRENPDTVLHIDEAYINYADPSVMKTALPLVQEFPNLFITRSFSKAHGMAGLRVGYALGQKATLDKIRGAWGMGDINMLGAIAAITAFEDHDHIDWEREENAQIRAFTVAAFEDMGFKVPKSQTNHIFVNLRRPAAEFRAACLREKVLVGRDFPPLENTHCRISLGSREEMEKAIDVFRRVLA
jgi:histidinol-phosphate aminotransferase